MIKYSLICENKHCFEQWFDNMAAYDEMSKNGSLTCPECGNKNITKAVMAPKVCSEGSVGKTAARVSNAAEKRYGGSCNCSSSASCPYINN